MKKKLCVSGCPCHILHNATSKASSEFSKISKFDLEDHSVDLYYWFNKSSKWKDTLLEYYEFCDHECEEVIRYAGTRWLCLDQCINRELKHFKGSSHYLKVCPMQDFVALKKLFQTQWQSFICRFSSLH